MQYVEPILWGRRFFEGATQVGRGGVWGSLRHRLLGRVAQRGAHERIVVGNRLHQVPSGLLGRCPRIEKRFGRATVRVDALAHSHPFENGTADDRVGELERILVAEEVSLDEYRRRRQSRGRIDSSERGGERQRRAITDDRSRTQELDGVAGEAGDPARDCACDCLRPELQDVRYLVGRRHDSVAPNGIEHGYEIEGIAAGALVQRCSEGGIGFRSKPEAGEGGSRLRAERGRTHHDRGRICHECGRE